MRFFSLGVCTVLSLTFLVHTAVTTPSNAADPATANYGRRIVTPAKTASTLQASVQDLRMYLSRITTEEFVVTSEIQPRAIVLRKSDAPDAPADAVKMLAADNKEACAVWPEGDDRLWLVANSETGLSHAIYLYLEHLGCRWYFPAEKWTIIPTRNDLRLKSPISAAPAFRSRVFSGTGGFGGSLPLDPQRQLQTRWTDWQRRNRFGGEFQVSGHTGEAFNTKYRAQLEANPQWRAMINGQRVPWSLIAKFCAGNSEVVDLYIRDRVEAYRLARKTAPDDPRSWAVSVEPADGGGHCTAPESLALGSVSDRVFHVANQVAKAVRKEFPDGRVSLFAYGEHAPVPNIDLEPNVYVQVIPYAFQRSGLTPDQLLDAWSKKVSRMGIYDYWSIPDWSRDLPTFDPLKFGPERLRGWHRRGVDSFLCESTYSSGAMGVGWYLGSKIAWQPQTDERKLFAEMMHDCFGPAKEPMTRMLQRWSDGFHLTSHELALSYRDVSAAWALVDNNPAAAARVADFGRYVEYLRLWFEYQRTKRASPERIAAGDKLLRFAWSIYDSSMIHAFRLSQLVARDEKLAGSSELLERFEWQNHKAAVWKEIQPVSDSEIRSRVDAGVQQLTPQSFEPQKFADELVLLPKTLAATSILPTLSSAKLQYTPDLSLNNNLELDVLADKPNTVFRCRIGSELPVSLLVTAPDGKPFANQTIATGAAWKSEWTTAEVTLTEPGVYRMQIVSQKRAFRFAASIDAKLRLHGWTNSQGTPTPQLFFFVPRETERLAIYANYIAAGPPRFFDPTGKEIKAEQIDDGHLLLVTIPPEHRGKVWSLDRAKCANGPLRMLNVPECFSFHPETLLVPKGSF